MDKEIIFYKPNQLITMNRSDLDRFQLESMNYMLKKAQDVIAYNGRLSREPIKNTTGKKIISESELIDTTHSIPIEDIMDISSLKLNDRMIYKIREGVESLQSISIQTLDEHKISTIGIFQNVDYNRTTKRIEYKLNNDITKSFYNNTQKIKDVSKGKNYYTAICLNYEKQFKSDYTYNLVEHVLRFTKFSKGKNFMQKFDIDEFKALIGVKCYVDEDSGELIYKYSKPSDFKKKVLDVVVEELKQYGILIELELIGRGKYAKEVHLRILKDTIVPDFLVKEKMKEKRDFLAQKEYGKNELKKLFKKHKLYNSKKFNIEEFLNNKNYDEYVKVMKEYEFKYVEEKYFLDGWIYDENDILSDDDVCDEIKLRDEDLAEYL